MTREIKHDPINHPAHYAGIAAGIECIDITRHLPFSLGNAVKYLWRAGKKDPAKKLEDLEKALWYINEYLDHRVAAADLFPAAAAVFALLPIQDIAEDLNDCRWAIIGSIIRGNFMLATTSLGAWIREEKEKLLAQPVESLKPLPPRRPPQGHRAHGTRMGTVGGEER